MAGQTHLNIRGEFNIWRDFCVTGAAEFCGEGACAPPKWAISRYLDASALGIMAMACVSCTWEHQISIEMTIGVRFPIVKEAALAQCCCLMSVEFTGPVYV